MKKRKLLSFILSFSLAGLDRRFEWTQLSVNVSLIGFFIIISGYAMYALVMIQNSYASHVVKVEANRAVIDTGLYAVIRHPSTLPPYFYFYRCLLF